MNLEQTLDAVLLTQCPRVFAGTAAYDTPRPYVTWQQIGGQAPVYMEGALPDQRCAWIQINVWGNSFLEAKVLMLQIEEALVTSTALQARPQSAFSDAINDDPGESPGVMQDFEIWATR